MISRFFCWRDCGFAALCKKLLLICAKWFVCNALETISIFSFAPQMMLREFGVLKGFTLVWVTVQTMFLNDFLLIYTKKLLFAELCKQRSFKKEIFVFGEFEGVPLNVRVYPFAVLCKKLFLQQTLILELGFLRGLPLNV
ncbi:MAG: hypothetical protein SVO01_06830 [Thermotogota bacterium]|nr:hypothetical protein [Thermotogota bacterium]